MGTDAMHGNNILFIVSDCNKHPAGSKVYSAAELSACPQTENTPIPFVAHRHNKGLCPEPMKSYLVAVRHEQLWGSSHHTNPSYNLKGTK